MTTSHQFGGAWTEEKLDRLRKYLAAYMAIFKSNPKAMWLKTVYVDAFAGTGYNTHSRDDVYDRLPLFDKDVEAFQKGSAQIVLEIEPSFDQYLFIELNPQYVQELERLRIKFPQKANKVVVKEEDANSFLQQWCSQTDWRATRAVVFLDPYGMQVEWKTIEAIAQTKAIDLWILFPLAQAVNRLLTRRHAPEGAWANRLTLFFGTEEWKTAFYPQRKQMTLFGLEETTEKEASFTAIGKFFTERLGEIFAQVADNPLPLRNSKNVPIYLLCFAAANPTGAPTAVKIAQHILGR